MDEKLHSMRHSAAHVLAAAVAELYPGAKFGVGPVVEDGFYYDIKTSSPITEDDFGKIEQKMREIINHGEDFRREELPIDEAIAFFASRGQDFKVELLNVLKEKGTTAVRPEESNDLPLTKGEGEGVAGAKTASLYHTGAYIDLCRGPHVANTKEIGAFKLAKLAGAYWRGDEKNQQLQRVYGYCFATQKELDDYLLLLEEAKKRDHRKLGRELGLFTFSDLVGPGLPLYTFRGATVRRTLIQFVNELQGGIGYQEVHTPNMNKAELFKVSGHYQKYKEDMFRVVSNYTEEEYFLKPMNCPQHTQIYASEKRSYKELPMRIADFANLYRDERPGELNGLSRLRCFSQDDGHAFCREDQIEAEFTNVLSIVKKALTTFHMSYTVRLSLWDPAHPEKYLGEAATWDKAQAALEKILIDHKIDYVRGVGEAAIYGPKMDILTRDSLGRQWQISTIQLDFIMPQRFGLTYTDADGKEKTPIMVHRAILGSPERFMGILIEHFAGAFPFWLAPEQVRVATVSDAFIPVAQELKQQLVEAGVRVTLDDSAEKVGKKIRNAAMMKIPWTVVVGQKEADGGDIKVNVFGQEEDLVIPRAEFVTKAVEEGKKRE